MDQVVRNNKVRILRLFPELAEFGPGDYARIGTTRPVVMIAMTARTGSTLLMAGLSQALNLGNPADMTEIFNSREILPWYKNNLKLPRLEDILKCYYSKSGSHIIFKTNWQDFAFFKDHIGVMFPNLKIIYLDRLNIEAQAVSVVMATDSNLWHSTDDADVHDRQSQAQTMGRKFDLLKICEAIGSISLEKTRWEKYFFDSGIEPARLIYEGFSENLQLGIDRVAIAIGLEPANLPRVKPYFKKLSDSVNDKWVQRVKNYRSGAFYRRITAEKQGLNVRGAGQGKKLGA